jgi:hypothetical protein
MILNGKYHGSSALCIDQNLLQNDMCSEVEMWLELIASICARFSALENALKEILNKSLGNLHVRVFVTEYLYRYIC